MSFAARIPILS